MQVRIHCQDVNTSRKHDIDLPIMSNMGHSGIAECGG